MERIFKIKLFYQIINMFTLDTNIFSSLASLEIFPNESKILVAFVSIFSEILSWDTKEPFD